MTMTDDNANAAQAPQQPSEPDPSEDIKTRVYTTTGDTLD
jgi:hypothetical protein